MQTELFSDGITKSAEISNCGRYRYTLTRTWGNEPSVTWIMLNPSTADASVDDPTIRRCIGFSKSWGFGGLTVLNLFAFRSPSPKELFALPSYDDAVGEKNNETIWECVEHSRLTVAAWGAFSHKWVTDRTRLIRVGVSGSLRCLGRTKDGSPRHPLFVPRSQKLEPFEF